MLAIEGAAKGERKCRGKSLEEF